jgi:hypothetical protein
MEAKFVIAAQRQLDESIQKIEQKKRLTPAARIMLQAILLESLTTRESEWKSRGNVIFDSNVSENQLANTIRRSFDAVLDQAYLDQSGDFITTRDILSAVQKKWCDIFPFC